MSVVECGVGVGVHPSPPAGGATCHGRVCGSKLLCRINRGNGLTRSMLGRILRSLSSAAVRHSRRRIHRSGSCEKCCERYRRGTLTLHRRRRKWCRCGRRGRGHSRRALRCGTTAITTGSRLDSQHRVRPRPHCVITKAVRLRPARAHIGPDESGRRTERYCAAATHRIQQRIICKGTRAHMRGQHGTGLTAECAWTPRTRAVACAPSARKRATHRTWPQSWPRKL